MRTFLKSIPVEHVIQMASTTVRHPIRVYDVNLLMLFWVKFKDHEGLEFLLVMLGFRFSLFGPATNKWISEDGISSIEINVPVLPILNFKFQTFFFLVAYLGFMMPYLLGLVSRFVCCSSVRNIMICHNNDYQMEYNLCTWACCLALIRKNTFVLGCPGDKHLISGHHRHSCGGLTILKESWAVLTILEESWAVLSYPKLS